jgi:hypothetical protein
MVLETQLGGNGHQFPARGRNIEERELDFTGRGLKLERSTSIVGF